MQRKGDLKWHGLRSTKESRMAKEANVKVGRSWVMGSLVEGVGSLRKTEQRKDVVTFETNVVKKVSEWLPCALER